MTVIQYQPDDTRTHSIVLKDDETVLEGLMAAGLDIPNACRAGACHACKLQATHGQVPAIAQQGLSNAEKTLGYFLSCQCRPSEDLTLVSPQAQKRVNAEVLSVTKLSDHVLQVRLRAEISFLAGQFLTVWHQSNIARSYSIASTADEGFIECHIKHIQGGVFSRFAFESLKAGDSLEIQGPMGTCIYSPSESTQPLLLVGLSTGLAPLYGILKQALTQQHTGPIHLMCGAKNGQGIYLQGALKQLAASHGNLSVDFIVHEESGNDFTTGDIYALCKQAHPNTKGYSIYLCGAQTFVNKLKKQSFLAGANMKDIHADAFVACS